MPAWLCLPKAHQQGAHMRQIDFSERLGAFEDQIQQRVVRQIQETRQGVDFLVSETRLVRIQEAREDQVILQQAAAAAPAQAGAVGRI